MESRKVPALLALVGVIAAVALFLVLKDDTADEDTTVPPPQQSATGEGPGEGKDGGGKAKQEKPAKPEVAVIEVRDGQPAGGVAEIEVSKGEEIRFVVRSDVDEEVHLHGYDVTQDVKAGGEVEFNVPATIEGVFEVELERSVVPIAEISVVPN